jgi:hypothetical protein
MKSEQDGRLTRLDWLAILAIWSAAVLVQIWQQRVLLGEGSFPDPDDALRLVQVRDWLAGQSWFDVTQYRVSPPGGVPMHWSRLVDVPIGAAIVFFRVFVDVALAEKIALAAVPILIHLIFLSGIYLLALRVSQQRQVAVLACVLSALAVGIVLQFRPMRIDHHGWQIVLTVLATAALFSPRAGALAAVLAGAVMALSLVVSIECLPMALALGGTLALRYLRAADQFPAFVGYFTALTTGSVALLLMTSGLRWLSLPVCDAMSTVYAVPFAVFTAGLLALSRLRVPAGPGQRFFALLPVSALALLAAALAGRGCLPGLFSPLIAEVWYQNVKEGLPIWEQSWPNASLSVLSSLLGIAGSLAGALGDDHRRRWAWIEMLLLQLAALGVSIMVNRAMATAHSLALPGNALLLLTCFGWAMRRRNAPARIVAALACLPLIPQVSLLLAIVTVFRYVPEMPARDGIPGCFAADNVRKLNALPAGLVFAPLDAGPAVLVNSAVHSVVATGHHRNVQGILSVISGFTASPGEAETIIRNTGARYVAVCRGLPELDFYAVRYPRSLAAALQSGDFPEWLKPVQSSENGYKVYEIMGWR